MSTKEEFDDADLPDPSLKNIIEQKSLQWIFVGGKGGYVMSRLSILIAKCSLSSDSSSRAKIFLKLICQVFSN
jgi:hypothetical protein